jgi:hypothetical protein
MCPEYCISTIAMLATSLTPTGAQSILFRRSSFAGYAGGYQNQVQRRQFTITSNAVQRSTIVDVFLIFVLATVLGSALCACGQDAKAKYPSIAPLDQYLMTDRNAEIALALSAAPESVSRDATVEVLGPHGYETAVEGRNGFVCIVERAWMSDFDSSEFWNPKNRSPICFNPPAARTVLPITHMRTKLVLAGKSKAEIKESIKAAIEKKELPDLEVGAMSYMLSKRSYLTDNSITHDGAHTVAHLMFYTPLMDGAAWGANMEKSPVYLLPNFKGQPEPIDVFIVLTGVWSDGTPAPLN